MLFYIEGMMKCEASNAQLVEAFRETYSSWLVKYESSHAFLKSCQKHAVSWFYGFDLCWKSTIYNNQSLLLLPLTPRSKNKKPSRLISRRTSHPISLSLKPVPIFLKIMMIDDQLMVIIIQYKIRIRSSSPSSQNNDQTLTLFLVPISKT